MVLVVPNAWLTVIVSPCFPRVGVSDPRSRLAPMSAISREEVARLANLARIDLTDPELDRLAGELDVIVAAVQQVSQVATADVPATSHPLPMTNVFRPDVVGEVLPVQDALAAAPAAEGGRFAVPQILGEE